MNNKTTKDHREFSRVGIRIFATVHTKGEEIISAGTQDVSMKGLFIEGKMDWPLGTECEVDLILEGRTPAVNIAVKGKVQRITDKGIAIFFTEVGLEAYEHLHNLIMLNAEDPSKVEQEFSDHLGLRKK